MVSEVPRREVAGGDEEGRFVTCCVLNRRDVQTLDDLARQRERSRSYLLREAVRLFLAGEAAVR